MYALPDSPIRTAEALTRWLTGAALPIWSSTGVDTVGGGFFEGIALDGRPVEAPRRARVVARQIYVFATAARRGWLADADRLVDHGLDFLLTRMRRSDGTYASAVWPDGRGADRGGGDGSRIAHQRIGNDRSADVRFADAPFADAPEADAHCADARFDLYEQAFVLFALAAAAHGRPDRASLRLEAERLLGTLRAGWAHPAGGFEEAQPRRLPLRANPHMHLLEAALAWYEASAGDARSVWRTLAAEIVELCLTRFIAAGNGALIEHFDGDWRPLASPPALSAVEPGHQFEWAWLLLRWATLTGSTAARRAGERLIDIGEQHGVDRERGVAINQLDAALKAVDPAAKLWPQTERIKAWQLARHAGSPRQRAEAPLALGRAIEGLARYVVATPAGLWQEQIAQEGHFDPQDSRASSLYHIVCAVDELQAQQPR